MTPLVSDASESRPAGNCSASGRRCCAAIAEANRIHKLDSPSARWIAADALRELTRVTTKRQ